MKKVVAWLLIVLVLSVYPFGSTGAPEFTDKVLHFIIYAITAALFFTVFRDRWPLLTALYASAALAAGYGLLMEVLQIFVDGRGFSVGDIIANALGATLAGAFIFIKRRAWG